MSIGHPTTPEATLAAFYEECGFSKKENEKMSLESPHEGVFQPFASRQNTDRDTRTLQESFNLVWVFPRIGQCKGRHVQCYTVSLSHWTL